MNHKLESRISNLRYADDTMAKNEEESKSLLMKVKESGKSWLKIQHSKKKKKLRSWHPVPSPHGKEMGKQWKQ